MPHMKAPGIVVSDKKIFWKLHFKNIYDPMTYICSQ